MIRSNTYSFARICSFHRKGQASYSGRDNSQHGGGTIVPIDHCGANYSLAAAQPMKCSALTSLGCFPIKILSALCRIERKATVP
jgi:hypothetical protein